MPDERYAPRGDAVGSGPARLPASLREPALPAALLGPGAVGRRRSHHAGRASPSRCSGWARRPTSASCWPPAGSRSRSSRCGRRVGRPRRPAQGHARLRRRPRALVAGRHRGAAAHRHRRGVDARGARLRLRDRGRVLHAGADRADPADGGARAPAGGQRAAGADAQRRERRRPGARRRARRCRRARARRSPSTRRRSRSARCAWRACAWAPSRGPRRGAEPERSSPAARGLARGALARVAALGPDRDEHLPRVRAAVGVRARPGARRARARRRVELGGHRRLLRRRRVLGNVVALRLPLRRAGVRRRARARSVASLQAAIIGSGLGTAGSPRSSCWPASASRSSSPSGTEHPGAGPGQRGRRASAPTTSASRRA